MSKTKNVLLATLAFSFVVGVCMLFGQPKQIKGQENIEVREIRKVADSVIVVVNQDEPSQMLVVTSDGTWVSDAREVKITAKLGTGENPIVECTIYKGVLKPSKPTIRTWKLNGFIVAKDQEFQRILDGIQEGRFPE